VINISYLKLPSYPRRRVSRRFKDFLRVHQMWERFSTAKSNAAAGLRRAQLIPKPPPLRFHQFG